VLCLQTMQLLQLIFLSTTMMMMDGSDLDCIGLSD